MVLDPDHCYAALCARDPRFDGLFFVGVRTTGIYCRPVCGVRTPGRDRCRFFSNAASAEAAGFRPCLRCRPELAPGTALVDAVPRTAARVLATVQSGTLGEGGLARLAASLGISDRQLRRAVQRTYGVAPLALLQTQRLLLAKQLLTDTDLPITDIAFASGFGSQRRFNTAFLRHYRLAPSALRKSVVRAQAGESLRLRLAYRPPLDWPQLLQFLMGRAAPGVEQRQGDRYLRTLRLRGQRGWLTAEPDGVGRLQLEISASLLPVLSALLPRVRRLFDLDAQPALIAAHLGADPQLAAHVAARPGLRVPGALDAFELALRAVLGQQVSVRAASTLYGRVVTRFGEPLATPHAGLDRLPPTAEAVADAGQPALVALGLPGRRAETVVALSRACADGLLDASGDSQRQREALLAIPGIGPWTADYIAMRAFGDPDAFPSGDLVLQRQAGTATARALEARAEGWRPWRAYAALHLWTGASGGG